MSVIVVICAAFLALLCYLRYHTFYNPGFLFCAFWTIIIGLGSLRLYGEIEASNHVYFIFLVGIICYAFGAILIGEKTIKIRKNGNAKSSYILNRNDLQEKLFSVLAIISIVLCTRNLIKALPQLMSGASLGELRASYWTVGEGVISNAKDYFIQNVINETLITTLIPIGVIEFVKNKKKKFPLFVSIYLLLSQWIINGGRIKFVDFILYFSISMMLMSKKIHVTKKQKKVFAVIIIAVISTLVYTTNQRQGHQGFWYALYNDYTCSIPLMEITTKLAENSGDITYGIIGLRGFIEPITTVLQSIGHIDSIPQFLTLAKYTNVFFSIGDGQRNNAYVSSFFYFYLDWRMLGVIFGNLIYGVLSQNAYNLAKRRTDSCSMAIYLLFVSTIFTSNIRFNFSTPAYAYGVVLIYILYHFKLKNKKVQYERAVV
ncbi:MAG TPA: O-antigen polymerase [Clostridium sp.]|uniref:O-antigen polymerase n=1 Tax=Clostridium sp. TaxID=1506 RepID=UPI002F95F3F8